MIDDGVDVHVQKRKRKTELPTCASSENDDSAGTDEIFVEDVCDAVGVLEVVLQEHRGSVVVFLSVKEGEGDKEAGENRVFELDKSGELLEIRLEVLDAALDVCRRQHGGHERDLDLDVKCRRLCDGSRKDRCPRSSRLCRRRRRCRCGREC